MIPKKGMYMRSGSTFAQPVLLQRNPEAPISAITWQTESVGFRRLALTWEDIEKVVNVFSEAYLSENPGIKPVD